MTRKRELRELSVGPFTLDCDMARGQGWTEHEIEQAGEMLAAFSMGVQAWQARRAGRLCEYCGRHAPHPDGIDCSVCKGTGEPATMAHVRKERARG